MCQCNKLDNINSLAINAAWRVNLWFCDGLRWNAPAAAVGHLSPVSDAAFNVY